MSVEVEVGENNQIKISAMDKTVQEIILNDKQFKIN